MFASNLSIVMDAAMAVLFSLSFHAIIKDITTLCFQNFCGIQNNITERQEGHEAIGYFSVTAMVSREKRRVG